jgi:hypothetical protein
MNLKHLLSISFLYLSIENKKIKDYLRYIPDFYKEIMQTWIKMGGGQTKTLSHFAEIRKQGVRFRLLPLLLI